MINVTVALGFPEHKKYIDPDFGQTIPEESKVNNKKPHSNKTRKKSSYKHHKHRITQQKHRSWKKHSSSWSLKAIAYGWNPPSYISSDWKEKAISKGWRTPISNIHSSIGIECVLNENKSVS